MKIRNIIEKLELMLEFPWVQISDDKVIDLQFEKLRTREEVFSKIAIELQKLTEEEQDKFIDILFSDYWLVMSKYSIFQDQLEPYIKKQQPLLAEAAFGSFQYHVPEDKKQIMYDFYLMNFMFEDSDNDDINLSIKESKLKLFASLKHQLLNAIYFAVACEFRHIWDSLSQSKADTLEWFKKKGKMAFVQRYAGMVGAYKFANVKLPKGDEPQFERPRSDDTYRDRFQSYRAAKKSGVSDKEFMEIAKAAMNELPWRSHFGGKNWGSICNGWLRLESTSDSDTQSMSIWIDHVYDLHHNTGTVFNKLKEYYKDSGYGWIQEVLDYKANLADPMDFIDKVDSDLKRLFLAYQASNAVYSKGQEVQGGATVYGGIGDTRSMGKRGAKSEEEYWKFKKEFDHGIGKYWRYMYGNLVNKDEYDNAISWKPVKDVSELKAGQVIKMEKTKFSPSVSVIRHIGKISTVGEPSSIWIDKILVDKKGQVQRKDKPALDAIVAINPESIKAVATHIEGIDTPKKGKTTSKGVSAHGISVGDIGTYDDKDVMVGEISTDGKKAYLWSNDLALAGSVGNNIPTTAGYKYSWVVSWKEDEKAFSYHGVPFKSANQVTAKKADDTSIAEFAIGDKVEYNGKKWDAKKLGAGTIYSLGKHKNAKVSFGTFGNKLILLKNLNKVSGNTTSSEAPSFTEKKELFRNDLKKLDEEGKIKWKEVVLPNGAGTIKAHVNDIVKGPYTVYDPQMIVRHIGRIESKGSDHQFWSEGDYSGEVKWSPASEGGNLHTYEYEEITHIGKLTEEAAKEWKIAYHA